MQVKKRNGEIEAFDYKKLDNQIKFTFRDLEFLIPIFKEEIEEAVNSRNEISSNDLLDLYIDTAKNLISRMYPEFANIAGRLYVQKKQKELYGIKHAGEYPIFSETIMSGSIVGVDLEKLDGIRPDVWQELDSMIKPELDFRLTIMGAINMFDKYLFKGELPQLGYMRVALAPFVEELNNKPKEYCADTLALIKQRYNDLTGNTETGEVAYTEATPKWISSLTKTQQVASCVVMNIADDSESILSNTNDAGLYSRYGGGISWYIGFLRSMGSSIDLTGGKSSGIVPFSKLYEATINAFNQRGLRKGSGIATYDWWGFDIEDFVMLNDKGGVPEKRARGLKLSVVINYLLIERAIKDEQVALFDPKEVGLNYCKTIEEFNKMYETYEKNPHIKKKFVNARDLISLIIKQRKKTGNIYILFKEVANNETTPFKDTIFTSNLCCVVPETKILTDKGYKTISKLENKFVNIWHGHGWVNVKVEKTGENQKILKVETTAGTLECTTYHRFKLQDGSVKRASELCVGDKLIKFELPIIEGKKSLNIPYEQGFFSGDGCEYKGKRFTYLYHKKRNLITYFTGYKSFYKDLKQRRYIIFYGNGVLKHKTFVPINEYDIESRVKWLAGLLDSDGTLTNNQGTQSFQIGSINKKFLLDVMLMLQTLGVTSKVTKNQNAGERLMPKNDGKGTLKHYNCKASYRLLIPETGVQKLLALGLATYRLKPKKRNPNRNAEQFIKIIGIKDENRYDTTFCFNNPINEQGMFNGLCTLNSEIMLPAQPLAGVDTELNYSFNEQKYTETKTRAVGDTWLCNLASININNFMMLSKFDRLTMVYNLLKAQDNLIDTAFYPNKSGEFTNKMYRPIGIGINNLAKYFARIGVEFSSKEAKVEMDKAMRELQLTVIEASTMLAKERGAFPLINNTKWKDEEWVRNFVRNERVADLVLERGVRFSTHFAIAPTACQTGFSKIQTEDGIKSLYQIMEEQGINYKEIEDIGQTGWFNFKSPIKVPTRFGLKEVNKIYFNGFKPVYEITFEDGRKYEFTGNHKLLVKYDNKKFWVRVDTLTPDMEVISV